MESRGIPNEIQVSQASFMRLSDQFVFERRGTIEIKGNQHMETYLLRSER
jgi:adenylate cyclase